MLRSAGQVENLPGSSGFSLKFLRTRRLQTRNRWQILFLRKWKFLAKIQEKYYNCILFWEKLQLTPKVVLLTWNAVLATLPQLFCQKPKRFSLSVQTLERFRFSRISSLRMFEWTRRMPYWRTLSFFANQIFLGKTIKRCKVVFPPHKVLPKSFSGHVEFVLDTVVENFCRKSGNPSLKIRKDSSVKIIFLGKKTRLSQSSLWTYGMRCWQLR